MIKLPDEKAFQAFNNDIDCPLAGVTTKIAARKAWDAAIAEVQRLNATAQPVSDGWVKCSERMPDEDSYIVAAEFVGQTMCAAFASWFLHNQFNLMEDGITASNYDGGACISVDVNVTHRMPLPAAPGGQDD